MRCFIETQNAKPSQQLVAPCVKGVEWGLGTRGLRMVAAFWIGILVDVTQEVGVTSCIFF